MSSIKLTFSGIPANNTSFDVTDSLTYSMSCFFQPIRDNEGYYSNNFSTLPEFIADFSSKFSLDNNNTSLYVITYGADFILITSNNINSSFGFENDNTSVTTELIDNIVPTPIFTVDSVTISEASINPCDNVKLTITTSEQAEWIMSPVIQGVSVNPFVIDVPRQDIILVSMRLDGVTKSLNKAAPKLLSTYFKIDTVNTPSSASITINNIFIYTPLFTLEYSINNTDWYTSNHFNNITEGDYTVYIRDSIGCSTSLDFTIDSFTPNLLDFDGVAEISNLNPIRYKEDIVWGDTVLKTPENTLSFEENVKLRNESFTQPFIKADTPVTQVKTNYSGISAKIIDSDDNETDLNIFKMTSNMNITDVRDGVVLGTTYNGLTYTSVKFSGGKTYDPITLIDNEQDYNLGTAVPSWLNTGDYINIQGAGWYKVLDVVYNTDAYVIVLNLLVNDFPLNLGLFKITSVYNAVDYERYEFTPNLTSLEGYYKIKISLTDSVFENKSFTSEWLNIRTEHLGTSLIKYYNSENNEINFNTGFIGVIRVPLASDLKWKSSAETDVYVTDTNTVNLESKYRGFWDLSSRLLPTMMAEKLTLILLQDRLFINDINYLSEENIESKPVGGQYQIKASLVKSNYIFNNNSGLGLGEFVLQGIPLSISDSGGFLLVE